MNTYIAITITNYTRIPVLNTGFIYTSVENCKLELSHAVSYEVGKQELVKLAVKYNLPIEREVNSYNPSIVTYRVCGFLD